MLTKRCCDCGNFKRVELFDVDRHNRTGRSAQCKACRRQRQNRAGYGTARPRALAELARQHPQEYQRYRQQARQQLAPDTAPAEVWDRARALALAELTRRHGSEWQQRYRQLRAAHPDWPTARAFMVATNQQRAAHRAEYLELLAGYAAARRAGPKLVNKIVRRAQRLLQLAHPAEYRVLYAAERAKLGPDLAASLTASSQPASGELPDLGTTATGAMIHGDGDAWPPRRGDHPPSFA